MKYQWHNFYDTQADVGYAGPCVNEKTVAMKTVLRIFAMVVLTGLLISLSQCNQERKGSRDEQVADDFQEQKSALKKDLRDLRDDINRELEKIDVKLRQGTKTKQEDRIELEKANRDLTQERSRIDETLEDIETASAETWDDVKVAARKTSQEVETAFRQMGDKLEAMFRDDTKD